MSNIEAKKDSAPELGLVPGSAVYETAYEEAGECHWVTRIHHGPYVAYHYIQEAADRITDMLNERTRLRAALVQIEGNDKDWNARWASIVAEAALKQNKTAQP